MRKKTKASLVGSALGIIVVTIIGMALGLDLIPAMTISLIGVWAGGGLAERWVSKQEEAAATSPGEAGAA